MEPMEIATALEAEFGGDVIEVQEFRDQVTVTVSRDGLDPGSYAGTVTVTSEQGDSVEVAVDLENLFTACPLMQTVHILSDKSEIRNPSFQFGNGVMCRVGRNLTNNISPPVIPVPN